MAESQKSPSDKGKPVIQSSVIMNMDATGEDSTNKGGGNCEKNSSSLCDEEFKICSSSLKSSCSPANPFTTHHQISKGILKPPQLNFSNSTTMNKPLILKPSQLNPLSKRTDDKIYSNCSKTENGERKNQNLFNGDSPKFVPLLGSEKKPVIAVPLVSKETPAPVNFSSNSSFVFGQNLKERVVAGENEESKSSTSNSNEINEMLFSSAVKKEVNSEFNMKDKETKSLSESAREYEESRAVKRKYEEVEVITGEEDENNILKICCKLFAFDKVSSSWQERGRGILRLNDFLSEDQIGSRLVFRTTGSLRVILNTKIWAEMTVDKASDKSIRLTALDANGEIKVFLVMSSIEDSNKLYSHLRERLEREIAAQKRRKSSATENSC